MVGLGDGDPVVVVGDAVVVVGDGLGSGSAPRVSSQRPPAMSPAITAIATSRTITVRHGDAAGRR